DDAALRGRGRARHADAPRAPGAPAAVWIDRRPPADAGRGGEEVRGDARAHPPDRGEGAAQAAASLPFEEAEGLPGVGHLPSGPAGHLPMNGKDKLWVFRLTSGLAARLAPLSLILFAGSIAIYVAVARQTLQ